MHTEKTCIAQFLPKRIGLFALVHNILKIFPSELADKFADRVA